MGQYFLWFNCDKNQYLDAGDFDMSVKINGYLHKECVATGAMMTLLATDWKDDRIILASDYDSNENHIPFIDTVRKQCDDDTPWDHALTFGENMAKYFVGANVKEILNEDAERMETCQIKDYDINDLEPYGKRKISRYTYVVNHSKKEYFFIDYSSKEKWLNPISYLLISAGHYISDAYGHWIGDRVGVTNNPVEVEKLGYKDMTEIYTDDYFHERSKIAYEKNEEKRNKDTTLHKYINVYFKGWDREKCYFLSGNHEVNKGDVVVIPYGREYKKGKVISIDEFSLKDIYDKNIFSFGEIQKVFDQNAREDEIEDYILSLYSEKEREFRKKYDVSPEIVDRLRDFNRDTIENSTICGCYHCKTIFRTEEISK